MGKGVSPTQIALRMVPLAGITVFLVLRDVRQRLRGLSELFRVPFVLLVWYALVGALAGMGSRIPALALWKSIEVLIVAYWGASITVWARQRGQHGAPLSTVVRTLGFLTAWTLVMAFVAPSRAFRMHWGPIPVFLQGWFPPLNPNTVGSMAAVSLYGMAGTMVAGRLAPRKVVYLVLVGVAWLLALSRTAYASLTFVIFVSLLLRAFRRRTEKDILMLSVAAIVVGMMTLFIDDLVPIITRGESADQISTLSGRTTYWKIAMDMVEARPLFGGGLATGSRFLGLDHPEVFRHGMVNIHNAYLEMLLGTGIVGSLPLFLYFVSALLRGVVQSWRHRRLPVGTGVLVILLVRATTSIASALYSFDFVVLVSILAWDAAQRPEAFSRPQPARTRTVAGTRRTAAVGPGAARRVAPWASQSLPKNGRVS